MISPDNYEVDNTFGVQAFYSQQTALVSKSLDEDAVENTKEYLQNTKKPRSQKIENYIRRVKTVNNYIPLMKNGAQKLTERELIKTVILKTIPNRWLQDLKRANNHNLVTLEELQAVLKPVEEADENDQQENSRSKQKPRFESKVMNLLQAEEEEITLARKMVINMTGKTVPIINTGTSLMKITNKTSSVTQAKKEHYLSRTVMNQT